MGKFEDGVDAALEAGGGFWFFKGGKALKTDSSGDTLKFNPDSITAQGYWPALRGTGFEDGVDAATAAGGGFWFFKGGRALKTDSSGDTLKYEVAPVTTKGYWPALRGTGFEDGVDAVLEAGGGFWFFKGGKALKTDSSGDTLKFNPDSITAQGYWPALRGTGFEDGVDAATAAGGGFWFFKGGRALKTDSSGDTLKYDVAPVTTQGYWPALRGV
ncbi:hypothetical protein [Streptomyces sp. CBMA156]|uniref:hypothetical protein n=1 Tax=Streptomyces sp. CBMA156 TaxID=1930280 RepID=UPI001661F65D|nr:hypothetical protein [Streptomyces sp. CBMA156]MBD0672750.1 hypothetical protein [Streptomyces sp. CBMA156]MBD0673742.1 hypothetical protein [Streptomyces sp. CBMA156]